MPTDGRLRLGWPLAMGYTPTLDDGAMAEWREVGQHAWGEYPIALTEGLARYCQTDAVERHSHAWRPRDRGVRGVPEKWTGAWWLDGFVAECQSVRLTVSGVGRAGG